MPTKVQMIARLEKEIATWNATMVGSNGMSRKAKNQRGETVYKAVWKKPNGTTEVIGKGKYHGRDMSDRTKVISTQGEVYATKEDAINVANAHIEHVCGEIIKGYEQRIEELR